MSIKQRYESPTCKVLTLALEYGFVVSNPIEEIGDGGNF